MRCKCCGKEITRNRYSGYCQACYRYFVIEGKRLYDTPEIGKVVYAENGDAICHICGKAFRKLGGHIWNGHHITMREYCFMWNLPYEGNKASNVEYRQNMRNIQKDYCITENLIEKGKPTRLKKGQILRHKRREEDLNE